MKKAYIFNLLDSSKLLPMADSSAADALWRGNAPTPGLGTGNKLKLLIKNLILPFGVRFPISVPANITPESEIAAIGCFE